MDTVVGLVERVGADGFAGEGAGGGGKAAGGVGCRGKGAAQAVQAGEGGGVVGVETFDLEPALDAMRELGEEGYGQVGAAFAVAGWQWRWGRAGQVDAL